LSVTVGAVAWVECESLVGLRVTVGAAAWVGNVMVGVPKPIGRDTLVPMVRKFRTLGLENEELEVLASLIKDKGRITAGVDIIGADNSAKHLTLLLMGVACWYKRLEDGSRQIYTFQYAGDVCDFYRYVLSEGDRAAAVHALTDCSIAAIDFGDLERAMARFPKLGLVFWRATMLEASIFRERLLNVSRRPALQRVANLLCEQLARREAIGITSAVIPLTQIDLADAAGLSVVHLNRVIQALRGLGVLANSHAIEVVDRKHLVSIARFDGRYLNMPQLLSKWKIHLEGSG
jgi:CRP-like cAMP-binding protein